MELVKGGVTLAQGFSAAAAAANIKYEGRNDMALIYSEVPAVVAGVFTTNKVKAAPVKWDQYIVKTREHARAVVLNSGIANACTGREGDSVNEAMAKAVGDALGIEKEEVLTASTGVIGMQMNVEKLMHGGELLASALSDSPEAGTLAAEAIMTTDTVCKEFAVEFSLQGKKVVIGGMSKGSGMIHPNMATMLCVITTDLNISKELLQEMVKEDVEDSFNMISVDRDTSTNDTMVVLASGLAKNPQITKKDKDYETAKQALALVTRSLARKMAGDGEGATKLLEARVVNAASKKAAKSLAKSVIASPLVKTALYGRDANWGRVFCALGYAGEEFDPERVDFTIESSAGSLCLARQGLDTGFDEEKAEEILSEKEIRYIIDMKQGEAEAVAWGCDLTYDYVKINGDYRS